MASRILCIIPARGGSRGVPRKNIRLLNGKPLLAYTIEAALQSGVVGRLVVSTEDEEIAKVARKYGAEVSMRPIELSVETTLTEPVMAYVLSESEKAGYVPDFVSLIQCTSPLLTADVIRSAVEKVTKEGFDSCITTFYPEGYEFKWWKNDDGSFTPEHDPEHRPRRQDLKLPYHENGAFYITRTDLFKKTNNRFGGSTARVAAVEMNEFDSVQIDSENHFWLIEELLKRRPLDGMRHTSFPDLLKGAKRLMSPMLSVFKGAEPATISIDGTVVGKRHPVFFYADIEDGYHGNKETALLLITAAKEAGAQGVKFGSSRYAKNVPKFGAEEWKVLSTHAKEAGLIPIAAPWNAESVLMFEEAGVSAYKIASVFGKNESLIKAVAQTKKPIIFSIGPNTWPEIAQAVSWTEGSPLVLLHTADTIRGKREVNLKVIFELKRRFPQAVAGFNSREAGFGLSLAAATLGAQVIERDLVESAMNEAALESGALVPEEYTRLIRETRRMEEAYGDGVKRILASDLPLREEMEQR